MALLPEALPNSLLQKKLLNSNEATHNLKEALDQQVLYK